MNVDIRPDPSPGDRAAINEALARLLHGSDGVTPSVWWREGLLDEGEHPFIHAGTLAYADDSYRASSNAWSTSQGAKPWRR